MEESHEGVVSHLSMCVTPHMYIARPNGGVVSHVCDTT